MKMILLSVLASATCVSMALAEPTGETKRTPARNPDSSTQIVLTEHQMDNIRAGRVHKVDSFSIEQVIVTADHSRWSLTNAWPK